MFMCHKPDIKFELNEGLLERTEHLYIFLFSAHHSMVFYLLVEGEC